MSPGCVPVCFRARERSLAAAAGWSLVAILLLSLVACSPVERVRRDEPKRRVTLGMLVGEPEEQEPGSPDMQWFRLKYVGGTDVKDDGDSGWCPTLYGESEFWSADRSSGYRDATFYDACFGLRSVDILSGSIESRERFRLPLEVGTNWSQLRIPDSQGGQWDFIPFLSYRVALEPELLLVITTNSELSLFANAGITGGLVAVSNGFDSDGWQSNLSVGGRFFYKKLAMELAYTERKVGVSSTEADELYATISGESVTFSGLFLSLGITF